MLATGTGIAPMRSYLRPGAGRGLKKWLDLFVRDIPATYSFDKFSWAHLLVHEQFLWLPLGSTAWMVTGMLFVWLFFVLRCSLTRLLFHDKAGASSGGDRKFKGLAWLCMGSFAGMVVDKVASDG